MICPHCKYDDKDLKFLHVELPFYHHEPDSNYIDVYICPNCCILFATEDEIENFLTSPEWNDND